MERLNPIERLIILCNQGHYRDAINEFINEPLLASLFEEAKKGNVDLPDNNLLMNLGMTFRMSGNISTAIKLLRHSERFAKQINDDVLLSDTLHELGILYKENFHDFPTAGRYYKASLHIRRLLNDNARIAASLHELGIIDQFSERFDAAMTKYQESLALSSGLNDPFQVSNTTAQIGRIYQLRNQYSRAAQNYAVAYTIMKVIGSPNSPIVEQWISELLRSMGEKDFEDSWRSGAGDERLKAFSAMAICNVCKKPISPSEKKHAVAPDLYCAQPEEHEWLWAEEFVRFNEEVVMLRRAEKLSGERLEHTYIKIYFDLDAWQQYKAWQDKRSSLSRLLKPFTFADLRRFFEVEETASMSDIVAYK